MSLFKLLESLKRLSTDRHEWQNRPCKTCWELSKQAGFYFGCYELQSKLGKDLPNLPS